MGSNAEKINNNKLNLSQRQHDYEKFESEVEVLEDKQTELEGELEEAKRAKEPFRCSCGKKLERVRLRIAEGDTDDEHLDYWQCSDEYCIAIESNVVGRHEDLVE